MCVRSFGRARARARRLLPLAAASSCCIFLHHCCVCVRSEVELFPLETRCRRQVRAAARCGPPPGAGRRPKGKMRRRNFSSSSGFLYWFMEDGGRSTTVGKPCSVACSMHAVGPCQLNFLCQNKVPKTASTGSGGTANGGPRSRSATSCGTIGYFDSEEQAAQAFDAAARLHRGDCTWTNFQELPADHVGSSKAKKKGRQCRSLEGGRDERVREGSAGGGG